MRGRDVQLSRRRADPDVPSGVPAAQSELEARRLGGHEEGPRDSARRRSDAAAWSSAEPRGGARVRCGARPALDLLTYRVPDTLHDAGPGARVIVPLGRRTLTGVVIGEAGAPGGGVELRDVLEVLDRDPFLPPDVVQLTEWVADYYLAGPGAALAAAMPPHALRAASMRSGPTRVVALSSDGHGAGGAARGGASLCARRGADSPSARGRREALLLLRTLTGGAPTPTLAESRRVGGGRQAARDDGSRGGATASASNAIRSPAGALPLLGDWRRPDADRRAGERAAPARRRSPLPSGFQRRAAARRDRQRQDRGVPAARRRRAAAPAAAC